MWMLILFVPFRTLRLESSLKPLWLNNINCFSSSINDITLCQRDPVVGFADCRSDDIIAIECGKLVCVYMYADLI